VQLAVMYIFAVFKKVIIIIKTLKRIESMKPTVHQNKERNETHVLATVHITMFFLPSQLPLIHILPWCLLVFVFI